MKRILFIVITSCLLINCTEKVKNVLPRKHKAGDIVYLKPDSLKVLIIADACCSFDEEYVVSHFKDGIRYENFISEIEIFEK